MKNNKIVRRLLCYILLIGLLFSMISVTPTSAVGVTEIIFGTSMGKAGETVTLPVEIKNNPGIATFRFRITYDTDSLIFLSATEGELLSKGSFSSLEDSEKGTMTFMWFCTDDLYGDGNIAYLVFKLSDTATGDYPISVTYLAEDLLDEEYNKIAYTVKQGEVYVGRTVSGVSLDKDTLNLTEGDTATLLATILPDRAYEKGVTWKSNNEEIATVIDGLVTAVKYGSTTITVTTVDGSFTDTCVVNVACAHKNKTNTPSKKATCQAGGWEEYNTCNDCGQLFAKDGITKINNVPLTNVDSSNHTKITHYSEDPATCVHKGHNAYDKCDACGAITSGSDVEFFGDHNYGTLKSATPEIHTQTQLVAYVAAHYQCSLCEKYFKEDKSETTLAELTGEIPQHIYGEWVNDNSQEHWRECSCGKKTDVGTHEFDNACDTTCDCGYVRTVPAHVYDHDCDKDCNICGATRTTEHKYDNACDTTCDCGYVRTVPAHVYDHDCDKDCNICGATRTTEHKYDNACDTRCNVCGATRAITHSFGDYVYNNDATEQKDGTKTRTCSVCSHKETIVAEGTKLEKTLVDSSKMFIDVPAKKWFKEYVDYSVTYGIFTGTSTNMFSPNSNITRAQFVQVLANLEGVDTSNRNINSGFTDVPKGKWYTAAVTWAAKNGVVNGIGAGKFDPNANVTREQMCVMLVNYAKFKGITLKPIEAKENFADDGKISKWAKTAVYTCQQADIVNGKGSGLFDPKNTGTRAEASVIFTKFHKNYIK